MKKLLAKTDMDRQKALLRSGLSHLIMSYKNKPMSEKKLEALGKSHSRNELNVKPTLYPYWINSLLVTIAKHDPEYNENLKKAWLLVLDKGVAKIKDRY